MTARQTTSHQEHRLTAIRNHRFGFTLVEVMIGTALLLLVSGLLLSFVTEASLSSLLSDEKNRTNSEIRRFTSELTHNARQANDFILYRSFDPIDRNTTAKRLGHGQSGDFLLLIYHQDTATKLIGYLRSIDSTPADSLKRFSVEIPAATLTIPIEQQLPSLQDEATFTTLMQQVTGSSEDHLFYNLHQQSILVNGERSYRARGRKLSAAYNFTITPRG